MNQIISDEILEKLSEITTHLEILEWTYLSSEQNENFKLILNKLYPWELEKAKLLNPWCHAGTITYNWEQSFYWNPKSNYDIDNLRFIKWIDSSGYAMYKINPDTEELESISADSYYFDWKTEYFLSLFKKINNDGLKIDSKYVLLETFADKIFTRKLYQVSGFDSIWYWTEVSLESLEETKGLPSLLTIDLERLVLRRECPLNVIKSIKSVIYSMDGKLAYNDHNIMDYGEQWTVLSWIYIEDKHRVDPSDPDSAIDMDKLWKILVSEAKDDIKATVEIIKNSYESIATSLEMVEKQYMQISAITWIPSYAFTNNIKSWTDSWRAKDKEATIFYKRIELYQSLTREIFEEFWEIVGTPESERLLEFPEIVTVATADLLEIEEKKLSSGLTSRKRAIMTIHKVDEKWADEILKEIDLENNNNENDNIWKNAETN